MKSLFILNTIIAVICGAALSFLSGHAIMFIATFGICYWGLAIGLIADKIVNFNNDKTDTLKTSLKFSHAKIWIIREVIIMNIFSIISIICTLSIFSPFIVKDISTITIILIGALVIYLIALAVELSSDRKTAKKSFLQKAHNL